MTTSTLAQIEAWQAKLLCRRYFTVRFDSASIRATGAAGFRDFRVVWALGSLSDGTCELLGSWPFSISQSNSWIRVADDLGARGLERITHVFASEGLSGMTGWSDVLTRFDPVLALPSRHRRALRRVDDTAQRLRRRVERSVARQGLFSDSHDAAAFVARTLMRAENGLEDGGSLTPPPRSRVSASRVTDICSVVMGS